MPNIIVNNYCNQKCLYCFANKNMMDSNLQKNMKLETYIKILKYLKKNKISEVRILWWEPTIYPSIKNFLQIASKWWFNIIIFSNIITNNKIIYNIFNWFWWIRVNCNINDKDFYKKKELNIINSNLKLLYSMWIKIIIWYNITNINKKPNFIFDLAKKHKIKDINLKITNSSLWWEIIINNNSKKLWKYIFDTIKKYHKNFFIEISCGLDKKNFSKEQLDYINNKTQIKLKYWCKWNIWKFDFNTDWSIFKCYPLKDYFIKDYFNSKKNLNIDYLLNNNIKIDNIYKKINKWLNSKWECTANKIIKTY